MTSDLNITHGNMSYFVCFFQFPVHFSRKTEEFRFSLKYINIFQLKKDVRCE